MAEWMCPDCMATVEGTDEEIDEAKRDHFTEHHRSVGDRP